VANDVNANPGPEPLAVSVEAGISDRVDVEGFPVRDVLKGIAPVDDEDEPVFAGMIFAENGPVCFLSTHLRGGSTESEAAPAMSCNSVGGSRTTVVARNALGPWARAAELQSDLIPQVIGLGNTLETDSKLRFDTCSLLDAVPR
jgi:hypothetical protein